MKRLRDLLTAMSLLAASFGLSDAIGDAYPAEGIGKAIVLGDAVQIETATRSNPDRIALFDAAYARRMSAGAQ